MVLGAAAVGMASCNRGTAAQAGFTTIEVTDTVLHQGVKRFGINLSGQSFYDSGQMLRNLTFRNPGFEGQTWSSILRCKSATATTCTDQNQYSTWPANFMAGAEYEFISGSAKGARGRVLASSQAAGERGVTLTLDQAHDSSPRSFLLVRVDQPGHAEAGWWTDLQGGARVDTELYDLSPHSPGRQALKILAAGQGQKVKVSSYFDSMEGRSFVQLHGVLTLRFRCKKLSRGALAVPVQVSLERLDTRHGKHSFFAKELRPEGEWQDYSFSFQAEDRPGAVGTVGLTFAFAGADYLLDDVSLVQAAAQDNPTAFRNEVVQALRDLHPGVLRYMDNGANFGSSLGNLLAVPFARQRTGASTRADLQEDIAIGLQEFLVLCKVIGAEPWFSVPPGISPLEAEQLMDYLAGSPASGWGARRAALGQRAPWTDVFPVIHLELGNEQWNYGSFAGATINDPTAYGRRAAEISAAMRRSPGFAARRFDLILGSWATVPWWTEQEMASSSEFDSVAVAPYLFNDFEDAASAEHTFGVMFAEPEAVSSRASGYMRQQAGVIAKGGSSMAVYEVNLGGLTGSAAVTQADLDRVLPSLGGGLAVIDHMLLMLRDLGVTNQCLFALPEYKNPFAAPGAKRTVPLWGAVVDMGGSTNLRRPQFLAEQMVNRALLPTMLKTEIRGANPLRTQPKTANGPAVDGVHLLQTFAFRGDGRMSLVVLNLSLTESVAAALAGQNVPHGEVQENVLNSQAIDNTNEESSKIVIHARQLETGDGSRMYDFPAHSMTVLSWKDGRGGR